MIFLIGTWSDMAVQSLDILTLVIDWVIGNSHGDYDAARKSSGNVEHSKDIVMVSFSSKRKWKIIFSICFVR